MNNIVFFPLYNIFSDLVKAALGLKDTRSIEQFFRAAGVKIHLLGTKKCVACEDLLNVVSGGHQKQATPYEAKSKFSKRIDELE